MSKVVKDLSLPFSLAQAEQVAQRFGTPVYLYDEAGIRGAARELNEAFSWAKDYKNYFAVKATPTPLILNILRSEGMGFDCSSRAELTIMRRLGVDGTDIFYTSNNTPPEDFNLAISLGATVNIDDLSQVPVFLAALGKRPLQRVALRYNPGHQKAGNAIIGNPAEAKYGMSVPQLIKAFKLLQTANISQFGLHTMVASNELTEAYFADTARLLLGAVDEIEAATGLSLSFINLGGGFGINYQPQQARLDTTKVGQQIKKLVNLHTKGVQVLTENGRFVTGPHGYLLSRVRYVMRKHKTYLGLDASMHNLMRPGMYGAYHYITILGKTGKATKQYDVVGSLCENNDKFAIDRQLPAANPGDLVVIHDVGAHGHAMGFNYNGLLRSAEVLLTAGGQYQLLRRAETVDDYLRNIVWP